MDFMELERQRGITIQSAATYTQWKDHVINIIDTPGHVDFTVEVERALRILDGAVLVLCAVGGVQSQTLTVNRQMNRYSVPRIAFINKLDRMGANPFRVLSQMRSKLKHNAAFIQLPIKLESLNEGIVDIVEEKAIYFDEPFGLTIREGPVPADMVDSVRKKRHELIECLANSDDEIGELFLSEKPVPNAVLIAAIRRTTLALKFTPVLMGTALKNRGIQPLLDAVVSYLPNPSDVTNRAMIEKKGEETKTVLLNPERSDRHEFLSLAFKLELGKHGQLTFMRVYQGRLERGDSIVNVRTGKKVKVSRLIRMNANNMDDLGEVQSGDIAALFGVDCYSGDTFMAAEAKSLLTMESMFIPDPVVSMSITLKESKHAESFMKALRRFLKEDPTFKMTYDDDNKETILHGMGELHLEIYSQRIEREYNAPCVLGKPRVSFRETLEEPVKFNYLHKKQSGGAGQFGRVIGVVEPIFGDEFTKIEFVDQTTGIRLPKNYIPSVEKGFRLACGKGRFAGQRISGIRMVLKDGDSHCVDSSDWAFQLAAEGAMRQVMEEGLWKILEPIMLVEVTSPSEFQGEILNGISKRSGLIVNCENFEGYATIEAKIPLNSMFGFSAYIRSQTQGKAEYTMEYSHYDYAKDDTINQLVKEYEDSIIEENKLKSKK